VKKPTRVVRAFVDTNILLYAIDDRDSEKQQLARHLIDRLVRLERLKISAQVLHEFASNAVKKFKASPEQVDRILVTIDTVDIVPTTYDMVRAAIALQSAASISYWDASIVVSAAVSGCDVLLTEDLNHGQVIAGVHIYNPFLA
jgi:predicted nucleic acid-binding protein